MLKIRPDAWFPAFVTAALFVVAVNIQAGWLFTLLFLVTGIWLVSVFSAVFWTSGPFRIERYAPPVFEGEQVDVLVRLTNLSKVRKCMLVVLDRFEGKREAKTVPLLFPEVGAGQTVEKRYAEKASRRGVFSSVSILLQSPGISGLLRWGKTVACRGSFVVYPRKRPFPFSIEDLVVSPIPGDGGIAFGRGGEEEFFGIREYSAGDSTRAIHWPSSAKAGKLMVREMSRTHLAVLGFYLDCDRRWQGDCFEALVRLACFAVEETLQGGHVARILHHGRRLERDRWGSLEALAEVAADEFRPLPEAVEKELPMLTGERQLFFFSAIPERFDPDSWRPLTRLAESAVRAKLIFLDDPSRRSVRQALLGWLDAYHIPALLVEKS